jgi:glycine oxidase
VRVAVIGAGVIGLACANELVASGHAVSVFDANPAQGATYAAAGMLSPAGEAWHGEDALLRLGLASAVMWAEYADRLSASSGIDVDHRAAGTLLVGKDRDDLNVALRTMELLARHGVETQRLGRDELLEREPTLSNRVAGGVFLPGDHSVNPRRVAAALMAGIGERLTRANAKPHVVDGVCRGVVTDRGSIHASDVVIVATGHRLDELIPGTRRVVRPVRGEIIRARTDDPPSRTIRASVHGRPVYVVPRADGEVVIGATSEEHAEEHAGEATPTVGGVLRLLEDARAVIPTLDAAGILDVTCRVRPGTPDNGPLIGPSSTPGLLVAGGHHRGGVLLAPITASAVRAYVEGGDVPAVARPFHPNRFDLHTVTTRSTA